MPMALILRRNGAPGQAGSHAASHGRRIRWPGRRNWKGSAMGTTIEELRERVRGPVITPDEDGYEEARAVRNGMIDKRPAAVVRTANVGDVMAAVDHARENRLDLAV